MQLVFLRHKRQVIQQAFNSQMSGGFWQPHMRRGKCRVGAGADHIKGGYVRPNRRVMA